MLGAYFVIETSFAPATSNTLVQNLPLLDFAEAIAVKFLSFKASFYTNIDSHFPQLTDSHLDQGVVLELSNILLLIS